MFHLDCTRDVHLCFLLMLTKASAVEGELHQPCVYIINIIYLHTTDSMTVTSLSANLQYKARMATDHVCHIALHQILSNKVIKLYKF